MSVHANQAKAMREVWEALARYRWRFVLPAFLAAALVLTVSLFLPRKYQGEAMFERRTDMVLSEISQQGASPSFQNPRQSLVEEIAGKPAIDQALEAAKPSLAAIVGESALPQCLDDLRHEMRTKTLVRFDVASVDLDRIRITFTTQDHQIARLAVNTLAEQYIARTRLAMDRRLKQTASFFEGEVDRYRQRIEELETKILTFEISNAALLPDNAGNLQTILNDTQADLSDLEARRQAAVLRQESIKEQLAQTPPALESRTTRPNPDALFLKDHVRELEKQLQEYVGVYKMTDKHPDLTTLKEQIAQVKAQLVHTPSEIATQQKDIPNPRYTDLELAFMNASAETLALKNQCLAARQRIDQLNHQSSNLFPVRSDHRKLTRDVAENQRQLTFWEDNLRRVRMAMTAEDGKRGVQLDFVHPCEVLDKPVSPDLAQLLMAALGLGLLGGVMGVYFSHRSDDSFVEAQEMGSALNLPVFGTVSEILSRAERRGRRLRHWLLYPINGAALVTMLILLTSLLYFNLERPQAYEDLKRNPAAFVLSALRGGHMIATAWAGDIPAQSASAPIDETPATQPAPMTAEHVVSEAAAPSTHE